MVSPFEDYRREASHDRRTRNTKKLDEQNRYRNLVWDQNRDEIDSDMISVGKNEVVHNRLEELILVGQNVFLTGGLLITSTSGFLLKDSTEKTGYQYFDPANFVAPNEGWVPPSPYCAGNIMFLA